MELIKPNKLEQAEKEVGVELKKEISNADKHLYHVALVKKVNDPIKGEYKTEVSYQQYNERSFDKVKGSFALLGYHSITILHDPILQVELDKAEEEAKAKMEVVKDAKKTEEQDKK